MRLASTLRMLPHAHQPPYRAMQLLDRPPPSALFAYHPEPRPRLMLTSKTSEQLRQLVAWAKAHPQKPETQVLVLIEGIEKALDDFEANGGDARVGMILVAMHDALFRPREDLFLVKHTAHARGLLTFVGEELEKRYGPVSRGMERPS